MAKINLLPWRDEYRQEKKKEFSVILVSVCAVAALCAYIWIESVENTIANQNARNEILKSEIAALEKQVAEIRDLKKRKTELLDRMRVIQELQGTRPVIVRYFDEMVRAVPDGVFVTTLDRKGSTVSVNGVSESNNRVSAFMRQLDGSDWFSNPNLNSVKAAKQFGEQASEFKLTVSTAVPGETGEEG